MIPAARLRSAFAQAFGAAPDVVVASPGRTNLIGDHTDYNDGFVLPLAIDLGTTIAARQTSSGRLVARSARMETSVDVPLGALAAPRDDGWGAYVRGPVDLLQAAGVAVEGLELFIDSDLPLGAGLSSSASVEVGVAHAVLALRGAHWPAQQIALLCQRAEHVYAHVMCGIMDQAIVAAGVEGHALLIDCRSLATTPVPMPARARVLVLDTRAPRSLASSAYNVRRATCESAARKLGVASLRDVAAAQLAAGAALLTEEELHRVRHVVTENERVLAVCAALERGDLAAVGAHLSASHASLRDDYEVSSAALDVMVESVMHEPLVLGARLTGAGFGGCVVALVDEAFSLAAQARVVRRYAERTGLEAEAFLVRATQGARVI